MMTLPTSLRAVVAFARLHAALLALAFLMCAGCTKTPEPTDVARYLTTLLGDDAPFRITEITLETAPGSDSRLRVTYKADLLADEHLFLRAGTTEELEKAGWKEADLDSAIRTAAELPPDLVTKVDKNKPRRAADIALLKQTVTAGDRRVWHGSVDSSYAENHWSFSNPQTLKQATFQGSRRRTFPADAVVIGTPDAAKLLSDEIAGRKTYVEAVALAQTANNERERTQRGQAEARAAAAAKAGQAAELARQKSAAGQRPVPLRVAFRRAAMGQGAVAVVQNASAGILDLRLTISGRAKTVQRLIRLGPAATMEIGWAHGWDFRSGDMLVFEHRDFLPAKYRSP